MIFLLLYMVFHSVMEALVLIFPTYLCHDRRAAVAVDRLSTTSASPYGSATSRYSASRSKPEW